MSILISTKNKNILAISNNTKRFNALSTSSEFKDLVESLSLVNIKNDFEENNLDCIMHSGRLTDSELKVAATTYCGGDIVIKVLNCCWLRLSPIFTFAN